MTASVNGLALCGGGDRNERERCESNSGKQACHHGPHKCGSALRRTRSQSDSNNVILPRTGRRDLSAACDAPVRRLRAGPPAARRRRPKRGRPLTLAWLGEFTRPAAAAYPGISDSARFGSLSGLALDVASGQWIGAIDDREGTRVAWLTIDFDGGQLQVTPNRMMSLTPGPGVASRVARESDLEAIAALPDGTFLMSEEGHLRDGEVVATRRSFTSRATAW